MWTGLKVMVGAVATAAALMACTPAPTGTSVAMNVNASAGLNGGLPAKATVFYLTSTSAFNSSDYGSLASNPEAALGATLLKTQTVLLSPGQSKQLSASFDGDGPAAVGVMVGFKAISTAQWRTTTAISSGTVNGLTVSIGAGSVKITK